MFSPSDLLIALRIGGSTGLTMFATSAAVDIGEGQISIVVAVTCTVFICGIVWWLSARLQRIDDGQTRSAENQRDLSERLAIIERQLGACDHAADCPAKRK